ncbi:MAG: ABC transporter permease [Gemmatimonadaceae bacterium]
MTLAWRQLAGFAWRDSRAVRKRLALFMSAISIGVAALVAIDSYTSNVTDAVREQSRSLLGGDLIVRSRSAFIPPVDSVLDSIRTTGARVARITSFTSMAVVRGRPGTRLVEVRAVEPGFPFYGVIETRPANRWTALQAGTNALVDPSLLVALDARVGDSLQLGFETFAIAGTFESVPGDGGLASAFGPRVLIPASHLDSTGLLVFGSRAEYEALVAVPAGTDVEELAESVRDELDTARVRVRTAADTERNLTDAVTQLHQFLGIVGLVALLLGGIGVASAIHAYVSEKIDTVAILRCLGATTAQVIAIYAATAAAMGLLGAFGGVALGILTQFALPRVLGDFMPVDVQPTLVPGALVAGLVTGVWVALIFALRPLLAIRHVSPLQALRRTVSELPRGRWWRDVPRLLATAALVVSLIIITRARAGDWEETAGMLGAIGGALGVLVLAAIGLTWVARRAVRDRWPFVIRHGVSSLYRPGSQTRPIILALGFGAFLVSTLYVTQANLIRHLTLSGEATRANIAFFDVQADQVDRVDSIVRGHGHAVLQRVPIVPMRVAQIGERSASDLLNDTTDRVSGWALRREYRSSWRDTLVGSEHIVAGTWFTPGTPARELAEVSLEREIASELGVAVGDTIIWDVQGVRVPTQVASVREVNWARFEPNFFAVFEPGALEDAPASYVIMSGIADATARAQLQRAVVDVHPNVSSLDLATIQSTVERILDKVAVAVRFMALFSLATGALVLFSAVAATRRRRVREAVLLRTLGATRPQIRRMMLTEYAVLGALGAATGMVLSIGGSWGIVHYMFELPFAPAPGASLAIAGGMMLLTVLLGLTSGRRVLVETPMAALREV